MCTNIELTMYGEDVKPEISSVWSYSILWLHTLSSVPEFHCVGKWIRTVTASIKRIKERSGSTGSFIKKNLKQV